MFDPISECRFVRMLCETVFLRAWRVTASSLRMFGEKRFSAVIAANME